MTLIYIRLKTKQKTSNILQFCKVYISVLIYICEWRCNVFHVSSNKLLGMLRLCVDAFALFGGTSSSSTQFLSQL